MADLNNRPEMEIDLFDFIEILKKRKYLIISIFMISILLGSIYNYWFVYKIPPAYLFSMVVRLPHEKDLNKKIFNQLDGWFASGAYKSALTEKHAILNIPSIETKVHNLTFAQLQMVYSDAEKGKQILKDVLEISRESELLKEFFRELEKSTKRNIKRGEDRLNELRFKFNKSKIKINRYQDEKQNNKTSIKKLRAERKRLEKIKDNFIENKEADQIYIRLYNDYKDKINSFIAHLDKNIQQIEYDILLENDRLNEINIKTVAQQDQINSLQDKMVALAKPYNIAPPFAELLPSKKMAEMAKILAITGFIGFVIGGFIVFLLELKDRRQGFGT